MSSTNCATTAVSANIKKRAVFSRRLLVGASVVAISALLPAVSYAQAVPVECTPGVAVASGTVECVAASPTIIGPISTTVDDLTLNVGDATTPTMVGNFAGVGITMVSTSGDLTLNQINSGSLILGSTTGVDMTSSGGNLTLTAEGTIAGDGIGIIATNNGTGSMSLSVNDVNGVAGTGIVAVNLSGVDLTIAATGTVLGGFTGIIAINNGTGALTINAVDVTGTTYSGITAVNSGTGALTINAVNVTGTNADGIAVISSSNGITAINFGTDLTIATTGTVTGDDYGMNARNVGSGALSINAVDVTGTDNDGISAINSGTDLSITTTGLVSGGEFGIFATNNGTGALTINAVDVTATTFNGIHATNSGTDLTIATTGTVYGGDNGIIATNNGSGALTINAVDVTGTTRDGINALNGGTDLTITATGTVSGNAIGIVATNNGTGSMSLSVNDVNGVAGTGIVAINNSGVDLTIAATGTVLGNTNGINASNDGTGSLTLNTASVTGASGTGIFASNSSAGIDLNLTATDLVSGTSTGIFASNAGTGSLTLNTASVTSSGSTGIFATNSLNGTDLSVTTTGLVSGTLNGIFASNYGTGSLTLNTASVTSSGSTGISAFNSSAGIDLSITTTGLVSGALNGIFASNAGTDLTIATTGTVYGGDIGIIATNNGAGALSINAVDVTGAAGDGINANNSTTGSDLSITSTGTVSGSINGVLAQNFGSGALTIEVANAAGTARDGIYGYSGVYGADMSITSTGLVTGHRTAVSAVHFGSGALTIDVQNATGTVGYGIDAHNYNSGTDISVTSTGTVTGGDYAGGIRAAQNGSGTTTINANNASGGWIGILAVGGGADMSITSTGLVSGGVAGIAGVHTGSGALTIDANNVTASYAYGIYGYNGAPGTDLSITATGTVSGTNVGVVARNLGSGDTSIDVNNVTALSAYSNAAVFAANAATASNMSITTTGAVDGGDGFGIFALNYGSGSTTITIEAGSVVSGTRAISTGLGTASEDTVNISGTINGRILTFSGNDTLTLTDTGAINSFASLGDGDDVFNLTGGTFGAVIGGDDTDTVNFSGPGRVLYNSGDATDSLREFEIFNFHSGTYVLAGLHQGLSETNFLGGNHQLWDTLESTNVTIADGAGLEAVDGSLITGDLENAGSLGIHGGGFGTFTLNGNFTQTGSGSTTVDTQSPSMADLFTVTGDVSLAGTLNVRQAVYTLDTINLIDGGGTLGGSFDTVNGILDSSLLVNQWIDYDLANSNVDLRTDLLDASTVGGLTQNQINLANGLTGQIASGDGSCEFEQFGFAIAAQSDVASLTDSLDQMSPEIFDAGVQTVQNSQMMFMAQLMGNDDDTRPSRQDIQVASLSLDIPRDSIPRPQSQVWSSMRFAGSEQSGGGAYLDYETDGYEVAAGMTNLDLFGMDVDMAVGFADLESNLAGTDNDRVNTNLFRLGANTSWDLNAGGSGLNAHLDTAIALGSGENRVSMDVILPVAGIAHTQAVDVRFYTVNAVARLTLDGVNAGVWNLKPYVLLSADTYDQSGASIGGGTLTAINIEAYDAQRVSYGYGATLQHWFGPRTALQLTASGLHHTGDTGSAFASDFTAPGLGNANSFGTAGREINDQYLLESRFSHSYEGGLSVSVQGYAQSGDIESLGGVIRIAHKF
jgi:hypothetical protein